LRGIDAQAVEMKFLNPVSSVCGEKLANWSRFFAMEIDSFAPIGFIGRGEVVFGETWQAIPVGADVVVDDVENTPMPLA